VLGNTGVRVETVHHVEVARVLGRLHRQIVLGAAAEDQHIDVFAMRQQIGDRMHGNATGGLDTAGPRRV